MARRAWSARAGSADGRRARSSWAIGSRAASGAAASRPRRRAALVEIARTLRLPRLEASHFIDNPASGRVLEKLGFEPIGITAPRMSCARGTRGAGAAVPARAGERRTPSESEESLAA